MDENQFLSLIRQYNQMHIRANRDFSPQVNELVSARVERLIEEGVPSSEAWEQVNTIAAREYRGFEPFNDIPF